MQELLIRPTVDTSFCRKFDELGYLNPEPVLTQEECLKVVASLNSNFFFRWSNKSPEPEWIKGLAPVSRVVYELATKKQILDKAKGLLGENVMLWGAQLIRKASAEPHPWHTDMESWNSGGKIVTVWIGLSNTNSETGMRVVSRSHKFGETVQELRRENGIKRSNLEDEEIRAWARSAIRKAT